MNARRGIAIAASAASTFILGGCGAVCMFAPCDPYTQVEVVNQCGDDVEASGQVVDGGPPQYPGEVIAAGASAGIGEVSTELDLWVRLPGEATWPVHISWKEIAEGEQNESGDYIVPLTGDLCPR